MEVKEIHTPQSAFVILNKLLASAKFGAEWQRKITAHVRFVSKGEVSLLATYHSSSVPDDEKLASYKLFARAIVKNDPGELLGQTGLNDLRVDPMSLPVERPVPLPMISRPAEPAVVEPVPLPPSERPAPLNNELEPDAPEAMDAAQQIARAISTIKGGRLDEAKVKAFVDAAIEAKVTAFQAAVGDTVKHALNNGAFPVDRVKAIVAEAVKALGVLRVETLTPDGGLRSIDGLMHRQVTQLHRWAVIANVPTWGWGAAGAGKTHMAQQVADIGLDGEPLPLTLIPVDPTMTVGKLVGFRNLATGEFVPGLLYKVFKEGGLAALDEIACGDPGILAAINTVASNDAYTFPNGEYVKKHPRFRLLVMDNTKGAGAVAGYRARNALDAATLDRFAIIEVMYDEALEWALAVGETKPVQHWQPGEPAKPELIKRYVEWVHKVRAEVGTSVLISPRAVYNGVKALRCGVPLAEVVEACVFKLTAPDTKQRVIHAIGEIKE